MKRIIVTLAGMLLLAGCAGASNNVAPTEAVTDERADVPWDDYAPAVRADIDAMTESADCEGLQEQFDTADANNDVTMNRTGHNNADLMAYIDEALTLADCY